MTPLIELGLWLNRQRQQWREAWPQAMAGMIAAGVMDPPIEFCRANTEGEGEALVLKMQLTRSD